MNVRDIRLNAARLRTWDEVLDAARAVSHSIVFIRSANAVRSTSSWSSNLKLKYAYCNECEDEISPIIESMKQSNSVHLSVSFYVKVSPTPAFLLDFSGSKTKSFQINERPVDSSHATVFSWLQFTEYHATISAQPTPAAEE